MTYCGHNEKKNQKTVKAMFSARHNPGASGPGGAMATFCVSLADYKR